MTVREFLDSLTDEQVLDNEELAYLFWLGVCVENDYDLAYIQDAKKDQKYVCRYYKGCIEESDSPKTSRAHKKSYKAACLYLKGLEKLESAYKALGKLPEWPLTAVEGAER